MGRITGGRGRALLLTAALLGLPACAPMGGVLVGVGLPRGQRDVLDGEVRWVDLRRGQIGVREYDRGHHTRTLWVDRRTPVRYGRRTYGVDALERGDDVRVYVSWDRRGAAWANQVEVRRSARDRDRDRDRDRHDRDDRHGHP